MTKRNRAFRQLAAASQPARLNTANIIAKLRRMRIELYQMGAQIDSALERMDAHPDVTIRDDRTY